MKLCDMLSPESPYVFYDSDHGFCINTEDVFNLIEKMQLTGHWIPCSVMEPKKPDGYPNCEIRRTYFLVTLKSGCVETLAYEFDRDEWQITGSPVIAWMPLPAEYKEGREETVFEIIKQIPSAQPEKCTEERTKTHACDCISRKAAIEALRMDISIIPFAKAREYVREAIETIYNRLEELPPERPEFTDEDMKSIKQLRSYHNGSYAKVIDKLLAVASAQPEPYLDSIVSEIENTISETKKSGRHHEIHIRTNGEMICYGLQLALEIIEEKRNEQTT